MYNDIIFRNEYFCIAQNEGLVYIQAEKSDYNINDFKEVLNTCPRIQLTKVVALSKAIELGTITFIEIGSYSEVINISVSGNNSEAYATILLNESQYRRSDKGKLLSSIQEKAEELNITYGIDVLFIWDNMKPCSPFLIARGLLPIKGDNATVTLYELKEKKPLLKENGSVNHYELSLINKVEKDDWMGERIEPTKGIPGRTVYGDIILPQKGKQEKLVYDKKTINATLSDDGLKTILTAKRLGAAVYENGILTVCNYLKIDGKVSFETGNVNFDGYVDIKDIIEDNFSVTATQDIQIMGDLGVGAVNLVESSEGDIYVRGGIAGQGKAEIICDGDLYTKFASDCNIVCKGTVHVGYYLMNSNIKAKAVILSSPQSKIIGGHIEADIQVLASEIGSKAEIFTKISVSGFSRKDILSEYAQLVTTIDKLNEMIAILKDSISDFLIRDGELSLSEKKDLSDKEAAYTKAHRSLKVYSKQQKNFENYLNAKGEGEVKATKCMHPNILISIDQDMTMNSKRQGAGISYYSRSGMIACDI